MASIDKRPSGRYRARWRETPGATPKTRTFDRKKDAERFLDHIRGDLARGLYIDPAGAQMPFREYAEQWRSGHIHRRSAAEQAEAHLRVHAYPTLGHRPLGAVRRSEIQGWVKQVSDRLAPTTTEVVYRWVATVFKSAVADPLIPVSPCIRIALPKQDRRELMPLTVAQVEAMADASTAATGPWSSSPPAWAFVPGEVFGLTTDRVDFLRRQVRVDRQLIGLLPDGKPEFGPPKSAAG